MTALMIQDLSVSTALDNQAMAEVSGGAFRANRRTGGDTLTNVLGVFDVMLTPTPSGPVPIPYPNTSGDSSKHNRKQFI
jgi:hypothetical protein